VALAAALDAFVHVADLFATVRTGLADCCTCFAVVRAIVAVAGHEVDAGVARGDTVEHQFDVGLLDMIAALRETMTGQHIGARSLAFLAILDAVLLGCGCSTHSISPEMNRL